MTLKPSKLIRKKIERYTFHILFRIKKKSQDKLKSK